MLAYAGGFATGTLLGMYLSEKLSHRAVHTTVICNGSHMEMEAALREAGFALTRYDGSGRDGPVAVLDVVCTATSLSQLLKVIKGTDAKAFFYTQELSALRGGYVLGLKSKL